MPHGNAQISNPEKGALPVGFWRLILAAVVIGNLSMFLMLWLGVPDYFAVPAPTFAVGVAGVVIAYRRRRAPKDQAP